jgi:F0F1-type ATP synthase membrane subunit b/b'
MDGKVLDPFLDFVIIFSFFFGGMIPALCHPAHCLDKSVGAMSAMELDLSVILIVSMVWALYFVLKHSFFYPINKILDAREAAIHGSQQEAREKLALVEQRSKAYSNSLKEARLESYRQQEAFRAEAMQQRSQILGEGRHSAERLISSAREEIQSQVVTARKSLELEVNGIADGIVKSILD